MLYRALMLDIYGDDWKQHLRTQVEEAQFSAEMAADLAAAAASDAREKGSNRLGASHVGFGSSAEGSGRYGSGRRWWCGSEPSAETGRERVSSQFDGTGE